MKYVQLFQLQWIGPLTICFLLPFSFASAQSCGDFIYVDPFGEDYVEQIGDCSNPFGEVDGDRFSDVVISVAGQVLREGDALAFEQLPVSLDASASFDGDASFTNNGFELFYHANGDYISDYTLNASATGTYTLVHTISELPQVSYTPWQRLRAWLLPTAHAQFGFGPLERTAVTFTIALAAAEPEPEPAGASSVLFLPGIQASRLYAGEDIVLPGLANNIERGDKLWEQTNDKRIAVLAMDDSGESLYDIYTEDVLDEVGLGSNIYKGFLNFLDDLATEVNPDTGTTTITEYLPFAYDWRYGVFDVATEQVQYENEVKLLKDEVLRLANNSHTGKVTIIGHSNGGLVAKALMATYQDNQLKDKVDKVVMLGTPQLGTPKAISAMLHGLVFDVGSGGDLLTSNQVLRQTIRNMPGTYTLLPSADYMSTVATNPLISTDGLSATEPVSAYGDIDSKTELDDFLLDTQNTLPNNPSTNEPLTLNPVLLASSNQEQELLNAWQAPDNVEVYEVLGTGLKTISSYVYTSYPEEVCEPASIGSTAAICEERQKMEPKLQFADGDQTVITGSANAYSGGKITTKINLKAEGDQFLVTERNHANMTESPTVQTYLKDLIRFPYLINFVPVPDFSSQSVRYKVRSVHSPVDLRLITSDGRVLGRESEEIIGSEYITFAGSTYLIYPDSVTDYTLEVIGEGEGVFTLELDEISPEDVQSNVSRLTASTTGTMQAVLTVADGVSGNLEIDFDGDSVIDEIRTVDGELVAIEDPQVTYTNLQTAISKIDNRFAKRFLTRVAERAERFGERSETKPRFKKVERQLLRLLEKTTKRLERRGIIEGDLSEEILLIISVINK